MSKSQAPAPSSEPISLSLLRTIRPPEPLIQLAQVGLASQRTAEQAWRSWSETAILDDISWPQMRMLAAIAPRVGQMDPTYKDLGRLKGFRRFVFAHTNRTLHATRPMLVALAEAGIDMLLIKGAARLAENPSIAAERVIADIDVVVRIEDWARACAVAEREGWWNNVAPTAMDNSFADRYAAKHSIDFSQTGPEDRGYGRLDLHHHARHICRMPDDDLGIWSRARPTRFLDLDFFVPDATDQLLLMLTHGVRRVQLPNSALDWALDAAFLIREREIDWSRLVADARTTRTSALIAASLLLMSERLEIHIPQSVFARLRAKNSPVLRNELRFLARHSYGRPLAKYATDATQALALRARDYVKRAGIERARPLRVSTYPPIRLPADINQEPILLHLPDALTISDRARLDVSFRLLEAPPRGVVWLKAPMAPLGIVRLPTAPLPAEGVMLSATFEVPPELFIAYRTRAMQLRIPPGAMIDQLRLEWRAPAAPNIWRRALGKLRRVLSVR